MTHRTLWALVLWGATVGATAADFVVTGVAEPATLRRDGGAAPLTAPTALLAGDVVSAGARGKVAMQLADNGLITLSSLADLQVFDAEAGKGKRLSTAKLKLLAGALRVDSRATNGKPMQDVRLNVGSLKTRILNADAWGANTAEGDTLCVIAGAVQLQTEGIENESISSPGSCVRREPDGRLRRFAAASDTVVIGAIDATRFDGMTTRLPAAAAVAAEPAASPAQTAPAMPAEMDANGDWTVVVLSLSRPEVVQARADELAGQGLPTTVRTATINGVLMHRVAIGQLATVEDARAYVAETLAPKGISGWPSRL